MREIKEDILDSFVEEFYNILYDYNIFTEEEMEDVDTTLEKQQFIKKKLKEIINTI